MSNNKQSLKLYTEEEIKRGLDNPVSFDMTTDEFISSLSPIELPTDDEISEESYDVFGKESRFQIHVLQYKAFKRGAKWMRDIIQGGNK